MVTVDCRGAMALPGYTLDVNTPEDVRLPFIGALGGCSIYVDVI